MHITVCTCTYRRPALLGRLLEELGRQTTGGEFTFSVVVADNDSTGSAREPVECFAARSAFAVRYCHEPRKNIALARNRALSHATGDFVAFIDDDEFPASDWLLHLLRTCQATGAAGVLGPVRPYFDEIPPRWLIRGGFCERPEHPTGTVIDWRRSRTGNVLFRRAILRGVAEPFRSEFGTGGEDVDFFERMARRGCVFVWCNEAVAYELVPPSRWTRAYLFKRALLRGRNNLKLGDARFRGLAKSIIAVPAYGFVLPGTLLAGQHVFIKYAIRFFDHLGRVLALLGLNPVNDRPL